MRLPTAGPRAKRKYKRAGRYFFIAMVTLVLVYLIANRIITIDAQLLSITTLSLAIVSLSLAILSYSTPDNWFPEDLEHRITSSSPMEWEYHENSMDEPTDYIYKPNRDIKIELEPIGNQTDFDEDWVHNYHNSTAKKREVEVTHRGRKLKSGYIVAVDGQDQLIPLPARGTLEITEYEFHLGRILNVASSVGLAREPIDYEIEYLDALDTGGISIKSETLDVQDELSEARAEQQRST